MIRTSNSTYTDIEVAQYKMVLAPFANRSITLYNRLKHLWETLDIEVEEVVGDGIVYVNIPPKRILAFSQAHPDIYLLPDDRENNQA